MHALDLRAVDEDLPERSGQRQFVDVAGIELEGAVALLAALGGLLIKIGSEGAFDDVEVAANDAVLVEVRHRLELLQDGRSQARDLPFTPAVRLRIETGFEEVDQEPGDIGILHQGLFHVGLTEGDSRLTQVLAVGAQGDHLTRRQARVQHQLVEAVVLHLAVPDAMKGVVEILSHPGQVDFAAAFDLHVEVMDPDRLRGILRHHLVGHFADDLEAHVLEHRQDVRERDRLAGHIDLEVQGIFRAIGTDIEVHRKIAALDRLFDQLDILDRRALIELLLIAGREGALEAAQGANALFFAMGRNQGVLKMIDEGTRVASTRRASTSPWSTFGIRSLRVLMMTWTWARVASVRRVE